MPGTRTTSVSRMDFAEAEAFQEIAGKFISTVNICRKKIHGLSRGGGFQEIAGKCTMVIKSGGLPRIAGEWRAHRLSLVTGWVSQPMNERKGQKTALFFCPLSVLFAPRLLIFQLRLVSAWSVRGGEHFRKLIFLTLTPLLAGPFVPVCGPRVCARSLAAFSRVFAYYGINICHGTAVPVAGARSKELNTMEKGEILGSSGTTMAKMPKA